MANDSENDKKFWGNLPDWSDEFAAAALKRFDKFQERLKSTKRHARIQRTWQTVFMRDKHGGCDNTEIGTAGRKGETLLIQPNRLGRLIRDHLTLVQQTKTMPEPMAANSDPECQDQVALSKGICEHYAREFDLEGVKIERAMLAEICGDSYLHVPWDPDAGNEYAADVPSTPEKPAEPAATDGSEEQAEPVDNANEDAAEPQGRIVYEGDYDFSVRSIYDVAFDRQSPKKKRPRWWIIKEPVNKHDLLQQVDDEVTDEDQKKKLKRAIRNADRYSDTLKELDYETDHDEFDDTIAIYFVYIDTCRARTSGRFAKVIDKKTVWLDAPLGEPRCPVFRLSQGEVLFRNEATTPNHDGLPLSDALSAQFSTIMSNNANWGMTRMMVPRKANMVQTEIDSGAAIMHYDHVDKDGSAIPPASVWNGNEPSPELHAGFEMIAQELDLVVGGSPVNRGDPNATKGDSGAKVAALFAAAQNIGSSFVATVLRSEEELYTFLINGLKNHASTKRVISIVGEHSSFAAKEYTGDKLNKIVRVRVQQADAMRDTIPGRIAMVDMIAGKPPEEQKQIIAVMRTGLMEPVTDPVEPARLLLEKENEELRNPVGPMPVMDPTDQHLEHFKSHMNQANQPDIRRDQKTYKRIQLHSQEHINALTQGHPQYAGDAILHMTGQAPLPPAAPAPGAPQDQPGALAGPPGPENPQGAGMPPQQPGAPPPSAPQTPGMPRAPRMPTNPLDGQKMQAGPGSPAKPPPSPMGLGA